MDITNAFTLVKAIGENEFYLLLPGEVDINTEAGMEIVRRAAQNKIPNNLHVIKYRYASLDEVKISDLSLSEYLIYINALKEANII